MTNDMIDPLTVYYSTEYHRRNLQVARACGAKAAVDQALERALTVKSIPVWLIAFLESAADRLPGLQTDLAAWRDLAPDAPEPVRARLCADAQSRLDQESLSAALVKALPRWIEAMGDWDKGGEAAMDEMREMLAAIDAGKGE